jgi:hypothetical protein
MMHARFLPRCRTIVGSAVVAALSGCTDPTAVGPAPDFLQLVAGALGPSPSLSQRLVPDSCPKFVASTTAGPGRIVPEIGATIGIPATGNVLEAGFGSIAGTVYLLPKLGSIVIGFDEYFAVRSFQLFPGGKVQRAGSSFLTLAYERWCVTTLGGQPATLRVSPLQGRDQNGRPLPLQFLNDMAVVATSPGGRRVNIRVLGDGPGAVADSSFQQLLTMVATWKW